MDDSLQLNHIPQLFIKTRSITSIYTIQVLRQLFIDFPSDDPIVRLVILLTVFLADNCGANNTPAVLRTKLESLGLMPLTRRDILNILTNPFVEKHSPILEFARAEVRLNNVEIRELVQEVAVKVLEIGCKVSSPIRPMHRFSYDQLLSDIVRAECCGRCSKDFPSYMTRSRLLFCNGTVCACLTSRLVRMRKHAPRSRRSYVGTTLRTSLWRWLHARTSRQTRMS